MIFEGPLETFPKEQKIKIPSSIGDFDKIKVEEHFWRLVTGASTSKGQSSIESKFKDIWHAKSTYLPATLSEYRSGNPPHKIYLTNIKSLPNYKDWFTSKHIVGTAWHGSLHIEQQLP